MAQDEITDEDLKNMSAEELAELQKKNCVFCKIAQKEIPAKIIHENEDDICILDINPASEGHILVYPKKHYMILPHMPDDALAKLFQDVRLMSHTLLKSMQSGGTTIFIANSSAAGQRAPHVLVHVFPRRENDGLVKLPKYEMNDEQIQKLKKDLMPYMNQVFGKRKTIVKEAEFKDEHLEPQTPDIKPDADITQSDNKDIFDRELKPQDIKKPTSKKRDKETPDKTESEKERREKRDPRFSTKEKVDLDDIARLFDNRTV